MRVTHEWDYSEVLFKDPLLQYKGA